MKYSICSGNYITIIYTENLSARGFFTVIKSQEISLLEPGCTECPTLVQEWKSLDPSRIWTKNFPSRWNYLLYMQNGYIYKKIWKNTVSGWECFHLCTVLWSIFINKQRCPLTQRILRFSLNRETKYETSYYLSPTYWKPSAPISHHITKRRRLLVRAKI